MTVPRVQMRPTWRRQLEAHAAEVEQRAAGRRAAIARWELDRDLYAETVTALGYDPLRP